MDKRRIVVTGIGAVTPLGNDMNTTWQGLTSGKSGVGHITKFDVTDYPTRIAAEVKNFDPLQFVDKKIARRLDPFTHFAYAATAEAMQQAGLDRDTITAYGPERVGMVIGSGIGGMISYNDQHANFMNAGYRKVSPFFIPAIITNMAAGMLAIEYNCQGPNFSVSTACATASHAVYNAQSILLRGDADIMIVGGSEAGVNTMALSGFIAEKAISTRNDQPEAASRPFDIDRDGFVLGEGAGILVLETLDSARKRGVPILAELAGCGTSCDAYHMTAPREDGGGAALAISNALRDAGMQPEEIAYINTHGTSTPLGDKGELKALRKVFGNHAEKLLINSSKSMIGHLLGAAGGVEAAICVKSILENTVHPTINLDNQDPECDLPIVTQNINTEVQAAVSNSFGFGGHNASLVFKKYREQ